MNRLDRTRVLTAPYYSEDLSPSDPAIFLAGPITDAPNWQLDAVRILRERARSPIFIFNPRQEKSPTVVEFTDEMYYEQVNWELNHLKHCTGYGVILFWMACPVIARKAPERAYAQTTRLEFGKYSALSNFGAKVVLGIDESSPRYPFGNERYIRHYVATECPHIPPIQTTLEHTCETALVALESMGRA